ncbi:hypothetical protein P8452_40095 [Trifolium repens]|nr:hypothetical protein P8452_40095 [Trifolium repens]
MSLPRSLIRIASSKPRSSGLRFRVGRRSSGFSSCSQLSFQSTRSATLAIIIPKHLICNARNSRLSSVWIFNSGLIVTEKILKHLLDKKQLSRNLIGA